VPDALAQLDVLERLLGIARPGALFPDIKRLLEWLKLSRGGGKAAPKLELHPASGFPTSRSLQRLLERQQVAKAWFEAHGAKPVKQAEQFNAALAAAELWTPGVEARVVSAEKGSSRLQVVHDRFCEASASPVRFTLQLTQKGTRHLRVERGERCTVTGPFALAVEQACDSTASAAALRIDALEDLTVTEVVRGELGPCFTKATQLSGPLGELARASGEAEGILSVLLERVGETVSEDFQADAWPEPDALGPQRQAKRWHLARERKLVCTPALEPQLKGLAKGTRMIVRGR
jgi:hypothetical protein